MNSLTLPANIPAEESVLGGILLDPVAISRIGDLPVEAFSITAHQHIYKCALELRREGKVIDLMMVASRLLENKLLDKVGGQPKLVQLVERTVTSINIDHHAELLRQELVKRKIFEIGYLDHENKDPEFLINEIQRRITEIHLLRQPEALIEKRQELDSFKEFYSERLDLRDIYPEALAKALTHQAWRLPVHPEVIHQIFITICAGLIGTRASVQIEDDWSEPAIIFAGYVANSGEKKSPALKILKKPLVKLQAEAKERYTQDLSDYQKVQREWDALTVEAKNDIEQPIAPTLRHYYFEDTTLEEVLMQHENSPGFTLIFDELAELLLSLNQYKGKGSDRKILLRLYNGSDIKRDRRSKDASVFIEKSAVSVVGGIQEEVLFKFLSDPQNVDGLWARFCFCAPPYIRADQRITERVSIAPMLESIYNKLDKLQEKQYRLSETARDLFYAFESFIEDEKEKSSPFIASFASKLIGQLARFSLVLHLVEYAFGEHGAGEIISDETLQRALALTMFYLNQAKLIEQKAFGDSEMKLINKVVAFFKPMGSVTHKQIREKKWATSTEAKDTLLRLEQLGYGVTEVDGKLLRFKFFEKDENLRENTFLAWNLCPDWLSDQAGKRERDLDISDIKNDSRFPVCPETQPLQESQAGNENSREFPAGNETGIDGAGDDVTDDGAGDDVTDAGPNLGRVFEGSARYFTEEELGEIKRGDWIKGLGDAFCYKFKKIEDNWAVGTWRGKEFYVPLNQLQKVFLYESEPPKKVEPSTAPQIEPKVDDQIQQQLNGEWETCGIIHRINYRGRHPSKYLVAWRSGRTSEHTLEEIYGLGWRVWQSQAVERLHKKAPPAKLTDKQKKYLERDWLNQGYIILNWRKVEGSKALQFELERSLTIPDPDADGDRKFETEIHQVWVKVWPNGKIEPISEKIYGPKS